MGLRDSFLVNVATSLENSGVIQHVAFSDNSQNINPTATGFIDELGVRVPVSTTRNDRVVSWVATRTGAEVVGGSGDLLRGVGWSEASSGGSFPGVRNIPNILHTNNFDLQVSLSVAVRRRS